ncbi:MAG TPA: hypothetical protein VFO76_04595 [Candidatus Kapabacteria bacterium]|nr:hypothetical protein [Candidatus Kapabacteria bacterium]
MPTYTSPVSLADFQAYINDTSDDEDILAFYQSLLDRSTERVYTYLDKDFTAEAEKKEVFWGTDSKYHKLHQVAGAITAWQTIDREGTPTPMDTSELLLFDNGRLLYRKEGTFESQFEHHLTYELPADLTCPETVQQVIIEIAAVMLRESTKGGGMLGENSEWSRENNSSIGQHFYELSDRHRELLFSYRRLAI